LAVWLALEQESTSTDGLGLVVPRLEAVLQFADELHARLAGAGVDGIAGALRLDRQLRAVFDGIGSAEIEGLIAEAAALGRAFEDMAQTLESLRRLKTLL
jgi:hypothetical protein